MSARKKGSPAMRVSLNELAPIIENGLQQGQEVVLTITGNSMAPFLRHQRDQVVLVAVDPATLQPGDVPLYRRKSGQFVLHRIVARQDGEQPVFTMLGDAQTELEPGIEAGQIVGRAAAFLSKGKHIDCDAVAYRKRVRRWHWWLPMRPVLLWLYYLPERLFALPGRAFRRIKRCVKG